MLQGHILNVYHSIWTKPRTREISLLVVWILIPTNLHVLWALEDLQICSPRGERSHTCAVLSKWSDERSKHVFEKSLYSIVS